MSKLRAKKSIGDVYEIRTSKGLAYFQYTHEYSRPPNWGSLVRVLQGLYETRLSKEELSEIVKKPHRFHTFFLLKSAINEGAVALIGNFSIPESAQAFPIFKSSISLKIKVPEEEFWSLWDGDKSWKVGKLSLEDQMKYPIKKLCDVTALIRNIETGKSLGHELC